MVDACRLSLGANGDCRSERIGAAAVEVVDAASPCGVGGCPEVTFGDFRVTAEKPDDVDFESVALKVLESERCNAAGGWNESEDGRVIDDDDVRWLPWRRLSATEMDPLRSAARLAVMRTRSMADASKTPGSGAWEPACCADGKAF